MIAAFVQFAPRYLAVEANLEEVASLVDGIDADLVVLPELFATGYYFHSQADMASVAETVGGVASGRTTVRLRAWARASGATFVAGLPERDGDRFFNSAVVVRPDGTMETYRKVHLFFEEKQLFSPGDLGFRVFDAADRQGNGYRLGVMICFDWYFPESARALALSGADVIAHPSNLVRPDCPRAMPIRALENHIYTITANRTGSEEKAGRRLTFIGQSEICDPEGAVVVSAAREETTVGQARIEPASSRDRRITAHNDLFDDRRPDAYASLF